jgi:hypothetical protein
MHMVATLGERDAALASTGAAAYGIHFAELKGDAYACYQRLFDGHVTRRGDIGLRPKSRNG